GITVARQIVINVALAVNVSLGNICASSSRPQGSSTIQGITLDRAITRMRPTNILDCRASKAKAYAKRQAEEEKRHSQQQEQRDRREVSLFSSGIRLARWSGAGMAFTAGVDVIGPAVRSV